MAAGGAPAVLIEVFGCQMNVVDAELVLGRFAALGFARSTAYDDADVVVFTTCSVRGHAEERVYSRLGALRRWKAERPGRVLAVMGCMAQREAQRITRRVPHVDIVCGTRDFPALPDLVERVRAGRAGPRPLVLVDGRERPDAARRPEARLRRRQAYVAIMRGCNRACAYCVVPGARGREVSRPLEEVAGEVQALVAAGVVEVCLLGQTVNAYDGQERGAVTLGTLLRRLEGVRGLRRLRFITSHPASFDADTLAAMAESSKLDRFLHMPLQSGSDRILKAMRRGYTLERFRAVASRVRALIPDMRFGCDWIVGFPGESEEDHGLSLAACEELRFVQSFVFKYSPRPGTFAAEHLADDVPIEVKKRRHRELLLLQERISLEENLALRGRIAEVLVEGRSRLDPAKWSGRDAAHRIVVLDDDRLAEGALCSARIVDATALTLFGEVESLAEAPA
ncbi:MAG: tRNA (N6-isopentenyl adenosine(37)-C2)-methylthiotransferase MiaB [Planctomycetes bacterium]|nr:tRNA (N6-isopentenyl adenosine(37)-C2)-methylthiotransferase MiaB [Planctomycetota bacterium]